MKLFRECNTDTETSDSPNWTGAVVHWVLDLVYLLVGWTPVLHPHVQEAPMQFWPPSCRDC